MLTFSIDHHLLESINLAGVFLAVLGFFYITYELFGRKPLKSSIRVITPGLIGALILAPGGMLEYAYSPGYTGQLLRGGILFGLIGGMIGIFNGIFVDWPPSESKPLLFSWQGSLIGLFLAFLIWFVFGLIIGLTLVNAIIVGSILAPTGGIAGSFWHFLNWVPPSSADKPFFFSWKGGLIGLVTAFLFGCAISLILGRTPLQALIAGSLLMLTGGIVGGLWQFFKKQSIPFSDKPPLFSLRGCLIGLVTAFLFGFVSALTVDITFGTTLVGSLRGALTAASFIGPAGALTGGISRYIFWWVNGLADGQLGGIGAALTLIGFLVQLLPPLVGLLDIPVR